MTDRQVRILLSGGIGSGKSTVGEMLRARGALVIDADLVGHQVLAPGGAAHRQVIERWPSVLVDGSVDRKRLADIVFSDPAELERLEMFTHSAIRAAIMAEIEDAAEDVVVVEVPLLSDFMGTGWIRVVVDAEPAIRLQRLLRRGMGEQDARRRMAVQPDRRRWVAVADVVIDNSGDAVALDKQVASLWDRLAATLRDELQDD